ncbi:CLUMA_CG016044, isoform A [Clunio marinus]|uniref:CLUMA_CG016044, isoform A n=1 Tax=Clunio marinus TaxID=568069 RepID=A0A1J1IT11_9DIPT|nr:CLUMA_CG016044, isoform A [Clunio marinus]
MPCQIVLSKFCCKKKVVEYILKATVFNHFQIKEINEKAYFSRNAGFFAGLDYQQAVFWWKNQQKPACTSNEQPYLQLRHNDSAFIDPAFTHRKQIKIEWKLLSSNMGQHFPFLYRDYIKHYYVSKGVRLQKNVGRRDLIMLRESDKV